MPFNGSGVYAAPSLPGSFNPAISGQDATPDDWNTLLDDLELALSTCWTTDGQSTISANIPMAGFKFTGLGPGTAVADSVNVSQLYGVATYGGVAGGTADAITLAPAPGISAYAIGQKFSFKAASTNTGAMTAIVSGVGSAGAITWPNGAAMVAGDVVTGGMYELEVQATTPVFHIQTVNSSPLLRTGGATGGAMSGAINQAKGADIPSVAGTTDIGAATGNYADVTGTNTPTGLGTVQAGTQRIINFTGALLLTHNATSLILPGGANITTAAGDTALFVSLGSGNWKCAFYQKASGAPVTLSAITNSLAGDVALNNTGNFFTGPTVAQGTAGTWFASGSVTLSDSAAANFVVKLWDGTTVIDSDLAQTTAGAPTSGGYVTVSVSGFITNPAGNIRISVKDSTTVNGLIDANVSGEGKDSTLTAIRIA